jgi:GT2 family glycosyltransferase
VDICYDNDNPNEFYINRVYRAWNEGVLAAPTQHVVMLNSDMYASDYWLDQLVAVKRREKMTVPTSLLVESGRIPSAMPEYVRNFGLNPLEFKVDEFKSHANSVKQLNKEESGRLFMPILVNRQEFVDVGRYPEGNPPGTTGDKDLVRRYSEAGFRHITALGSIVYHVQTGEQEWV